jgi:arginyl-tRNA synthetase
MQELIQKKISEALGVPAEQVSISVPEIAEFGHYSTNIAMRLAREMKKPSFELAQDFARVIANNANESMFAKVEAVKPGFINFWILEQFLQEEFAKTLHVTRSALHERETVIVEYSAPNIAKPMHVGHLRSTIIGDALANIYEYLGYKTVRWNYFGDWGTQFGKLIAAYKLWGDKKTIEQDPINELVKLYIRFHEEMKSKPELDQQGQLEFKKLEEGDKENRKLWEWFKDESLLSFKKIYKRLGVRFDIEIGEQHYEEALRDVLKELKEKELSVPSDQSFAKATEGEGRSWIVHLEKFNLPVALVQKSDGASLYITRDIASLEHRLSRYKPNKILYVVANEQALHFSQLFGIADLLGLKKDVALEHVKFGMILGEDGKKLSTREGKAVQLEDVVNEITKRAYEVVSQKNPALSEEERKAVAEAVGIGALKYNDLKENRLSDIMFNWQQMLDFNGDSAPYLQYTAVRLTNIVRKSEIRISKLETNGENLKELKMEIEISLMKKVLDFNDVVRLCAETNFTSHLAKYLFELAKLGNQYYESVRILEDPSASSGQVGSADSPQVKMARRNGRLVLVGSIAETIAKGLGLLGITVPERI